jgi:hypothetical protein
MNKHREFMSHRLPVFTHADDPLDADDWLKTVGKMLTTAQCDDREKVLFAAGRLQGSAGAWWDAYTTAHATPNAITWQEFSESFRNHHIPAGLMRLKKKEFLSLQQGGMSVTEYRDRFIELSRYAPEEVADDPKKQERFMEGLAGLLRYQLTSHTFLVFPAPVRQGHHPGGHAHRIERSEEEGHYFCAVWEQHSSPFHSTAGNNTPCRRFSW